MTCTGARIYARSAAAKVGSAVAACWLSSPRYYTNGLIRRQTEAWCRGFVIVPCDAPTPPTRSYCNVKRNRVLSYPGLQKLSEPYTCVSTRPSFS